MVVVPAAQDRIQLLNHLFETHVVTSPDLHPDLFTDTLYGSFRGPDSTHLFQLLADTGDGA
jgi:hypothetical protein